ncbi:SAM-dependent methyltransferase [Moraxella osloensis]|uniref:SAM-dependent methyltransferase n=1 Tax=Faucicola osloensis TaxID=34062 RepID=A0AAD0AX25_FAUOS|nr:class I SAM-dependent methyltransferase [Moraxella osloensis]ATW70734.1 SAM-dependent methyltransferase [Moraxella osloensis]ATY49435.1 SAM-dependent methyltransferase [Moraxella osloensis]
MDTLDYYQRNAKDFFSQTINVDMQNVYQPFLEYLPKPHLANQQKILDVGCGSGRDSVFFANQGFEVVAIDGSQNVIDLAKQTDTRIDWQCLRFDEIAKQSWQNQFTGIWACASLLHVPFDDLTKLLNDLIRCLKSDGILYASFKYGDSEREKDGRFFCDINEQRWQLIEEQLDSAKALKLWQTVDNRVDRQETWWNVLLKTY